MQQTIPMPHVATVMPQRITSLFAASLGRVICFLVVVLVGLPFASSQSIRISKHDDSLVGGQPSSVTVDFESPNDGIIQLQLFTADWKKKSETALNVPAGSGTKTLQVTVPSDAKIDASYLWQVVLYSRDWKKLSEASVTKIHVTGVSAKDSEPATEPKEGTKEVSKEDAPASVTVTPNGHAIGIPEGNNAWVPPGDWQLDWADEFSGDGLPKEWYPLLGYDPDSFKQSAAKGIRWSGSTADSAWMYSTKSGNHALNGDGQLVLRIACDKTQTNEHGPKVNAAYLLSGYPEQWDSTEPNNVKWGGRFFSPADGPLYICASVRTDKVLGYSTWFAFWLFSETRAYNGNPADGTEVDIIEIAKGAPQYMSQSFNVANHWKDSSGSESKQFNSASRPRPTEYVDVNDDQFHEYGIEWSKDSMKCYVDGKLYYTFTENIPTDPVDMMLLLTMEFKPNAWDPNQGDGRTEGPFVSDTPQSRELSRALVDYVRVFRKQ